jgi:2-dehydropantoate 2-reductase
MNPNEPILIVGTGALACLFAARLAATGRDVGMLGSWPEGLAALQRDGVSVQESDGAVHTYSVRASARPDDFEESRYALVLVKAWQTERAAALLTECLAPDGLALSLQNGLGNRELLTEQLGAERVALGVTTTGATLLGPGQVQAGGEGTISLGAHARIAPVAEALKDAGFQVEMAEDVESLAWSKLVINAAINPLTAIHGIPNGGLLEEPGLHAQMRQLAEEVAAVAEAKGVKLSFANPAAAAEDVARRTASNYSSMLQDLRRGAPTEIEAINGAVVREAEALGVSVPMNKKMLELISSIVAERA